MILRRYSYIMCMRKKFSLSKNSWLKWKNITHQKKCYFCFGFVAYWLVTWFYPMKSRKSIHSLSFLTLSTSMLSLTHILPTMTMMSQVQNKLLFVYQKCLEKGIGKFKRKLRSIHLSLSGDSWYAGLNKQL